MPLPQNLAISPAAMDLGLGGNLQQQLAEEELRKKKKLLQQASAMSGTAGSATQMLFPNMSNPLG